MARLKGEDRGVFEKEKGVWYARWHDLDGKEHKVKVGSKSSAKAYYQQRKAEVTEGRLFTHHRNRERPKRLAEVLAHFREKRAADPELRNQGEDQRYVDYWTAKFGGELLKDLSAEKLDAWRRQRRSEGRKPSTVNRAVTYLRAYLNLAIEAGWTTSNPAAALPQYRENNQRKRHLSEDEQTRLWGVLKDDEHKDIVAFAIGTLLREGEEFGLRWQDVDLGGAALHLVDSKNGEGRSVALAPWVVELLRRQKVRAGSSTWVWPSPKDPSKARNSHNFKGRIFRKYLAKAGITDFRWHDLRHTGASRLVMATGDLYAVGELMGHKSTRMTKRYSHLSPKHQQKLVANLQDPLAVTREVVCA